LTYATSHDEGQADRGEYRQAAGAVARLVTLEPIRGFPPSWSIDELQAALS
jgi:hypothetical protein